MRTFLARCLVATASAMAVQAASAATHTFTTPSQPLPASPGNGLTGQLWANVNPATDTLAAAQAIIAAGVATANFLSTTVDYPAGATAVTSTSATYASVLDATATATLDNAAVLSDDVLNTVMRFAGFFAVFSANEEWTFQILSDDGSAVDIQGTRVLNADGIHAYGGASTTVAFTTPGLYALDVLFFESQATEWGLTFSGAQTGGALTSALTPRLYSLIEHADPSDPRLGSIATGVPEPGGVALLALAGAAAAAGGRRPRRG